MESTTDERLDHPALSLVVVVASLWMVGVLNGCTSREEPEHALVIALESMPQNLDPRFATDAASSRIGEIVFRSLTRLDRNLQRIPDLAIDWSVESPTLVTFRLRDDAVFHDGRPLTADDVRATYESILDPAVASPKRSLLDFLDRIETPDPHTVHFHLKEPFSPFLEATGVGILPRESLSRRGELPIGSGPFRIASIEPNHEIRLAALPGHTGLAVIRFRVIPDETVRVLETRKATVHFVQNGIEPENLDWLKDQPGLCLRESPGSTFQYLGINLRDPVLRDRRVRQAIAHAVDRRKLVDYLLNGTARVATGLLAPGHWAYEPDVRQYGYDPAAARRLLDEAGIADPDGDGPRPRLRLTYKTTTLASRKRVAEAIQAMLGEVGIAVEIRSFEWGTFYDDIRRGNFQIYGLAWVGVADPDVYYTILSSTMVPPRGNNRGHFADPEIDRLTLLGRTTFDPQARQEIYSQVQRIAADQLPFIPLWWENNVLVQDRRLCGFESPPDGGWVSLRTAWWNDRLPGGNEPPVSGPCGCGSDERK